MSPSQKTAQRIDNIILILEKYALQGQVISHKKLADDYNSQKYETDIILHESFYAIHSKQEVHGETRIVTLVEMINDRIEDEKVFLTSLITKDDNSHPEQGIIGFIQNKSKCKVSLIEKVQNNTFLWKMLIRGIQSTVCNHYSGSLMIVNNEEVEEKVTTLPEEERVAS